ncbi:MAG: hypothetical protein P1U34_01645 [Coxiellaceae bacterium]|nr:hypothetical protein [Coxiellaceae bacterium]
MSAVSSIRWNDETLYQRAKQFADINNKKLNAIMLEAITEYLNNHSNDAEVSELYRQTLQFSRAHKADSLNLDAWTEGQDTEDWK